MNWSNILTATLSAFFGVNAMYFAISAIGLNVQFGYAGLLNFGQAGFMACGAYAVGMTAHYYGISFWWGIPIAILLRRGLRSHHGRPHAAPAEPTTWPS